MLGLRSNGSRPAPFAGAGLLVANGVTRKTGIDVKNVANPRSTATA